MEYLRFFTPSMVRAPAEARELIGSAGPLAERAALRRMWEVGPHAYQAVALAVPLPDGSGIADLLVRRRYTLELGSVIVEGSLCDAIERALRAVDTFRQNDIALHALLREYEHRGVNAGMAAAKALHQAFVLAPPGVYAGASDEIARAREIRALYEPTPLGFRFLSFEEEASAFRIVAATSPFGDEISLIRDVSGASKKN